MTSSLSAWRSGAESVWFTGPTGEPEDPAAIVRSLYRHLAVAATQLAHEEGTEAAASARYLAAGARFRGLLEQAGNLRAQASLPAPIVEFPGGQIVPMVEVLGAACRREQIRPPLRSIEPDLVHEARLILQADPWRLPDQPPCPGPDPLLIRGDRLSADELPCVWNGSI